MDFSYLDDWLEEEPIIVEGGEGYRNIWVVAEAEGGRLVPESLAAMGQARGLADRIGVYAYGVLVGDGVAALGRNLVQHGADKVLAADDASLAEYQPEGWTEVLAGMVETYRPEIVLLPGTTLGNDLAPRLAQRLDTGLASHCVALDLDMAERLLLGTSAVLGGEVFHTVTCPTARPQMATLEPGYFRVPYADPSRSGDVELVAVEARIGRLAWGERQTTVELPEVPLSRAMRVVAGGRGLGDAEGFGLVERLAEVLGAAVAGSRGAFDEGWIEEGQIVGVGGVSIAPELYVACGISGDIYHSFGAQKAQFVVAINRDENAPLMKAANLAAVGDAREVILALVEELARQ